MSSEGLHAPREVLSQEACFLHNAITSLVEELEAADWSAPDRALQGVLAAATQLDNSGYRGPYALASSPVLYNNLFRLYPGTDVLALEHLRRLCTAGIYKAAIEGGVLVDTRVGVLIFGQDLSAGLQQPGRRPLPCVSERKHRLADRRAGSDLRDLGACSGFVINLWQFAPRRVRGAREARFDARSPRPAVPGRKLPHGGPMTKRLLAPGAIALLLSLAACGNPYDPGQRAVGGGLLGAGAGAAIGAAAGGGTGAAIGAATGGALGAITGAATTPPPPGYYPPPPPPPYYR